jgi:CMP/dCMP kinase
MPNISRFINTMQAINTSSIPVIAIDGPSASGKGTVATKVANQLGYHYLDSGALYRIVAFVTHQQHIDWHDEEAVAHCASELDIHFNNEQILVNQINVTTAIRTELMGTGASTVAVHPKVRAALFNVQHNFRKIPGLVADGRDMGTVIFPDAFVKIFLTASTEIRAQRRYDQLIKTTSVESVSFEAILNDLKTRDARDQNRDSAPLIVAQSAVTINTDHLSIDDAVQKILKLVQEST